METRAHFVLIGTFAIAGLLAILGFLLWFAQVELDQQFAYYDIRFSSVSGLSNASDVRFSGLPVGQVVFVRLAPERDGSVLVRVEVDAATPVREDSIARIEAQGVTGVSYVGIGPGTPDAPILEPTEDRPIPEIVAGRSTLQSLSEDAPRLLENALAVIEEISEMFDEENKNRVNTILANVEEASKAFASSLEDFSAVTGSVSEFAEQIGQFNETLDELSGDLTTVLETADTALGTFAELSEQGKGVLTEANTTLTTAQSAIARTEAYIAEDLAQTTNELRETSAEVRRQVGTLSLGATEVMDSLKQTGETATARLDEAQETIASANALIARLDGVAGVVGETAGRVDSLIEEEGRPLVAETRAMVDAGTRAASAVTDLATQGEGVIADAGETLDLAKNTLTSAGSAINTTETFIAQDLTRTTTDLRETSAEVRRQVGTLSTSATEVMDTLKVTGETATARLEEARETIAATNALIARIDTVAGSVSDTASLVDDLVRNEGQPLMADARLMVTEARRAVTAVTAVVEQDLPVVVSDIRAATANANRTITEVGENLSTASAGVDELITVARGTLEDATVAFDNANVTLEAINEAMDSAIETLDIAEQAFAGADRIMNEDVAGIVEGLRGTIDTLQTAIRRVSDDIPGITADLRAASQSATATFADIRRVTNASAPAVQEFTTQTLPLFTRLAQESRSLIGNLDRLTNQLQRDPARFLLDRETPEFRR
ncbi:MlaD family protein [Marinovum sp.]|uniref:MCE family protein n=1 Tax=Marinovum sp. TaxID=2024839 RepID=UPI003A958274